MFARSTARRASGRFVWFVAFLAVVDAGAASAQRGVTPQPVPTARAAAPIDVTGQWVSVVTQDWRWRMVTPARGDYFGIPMNLASKKVADAWDPDKDERMGEQCRSYGAAAIMGVPGRLRIGWLDENTLKVETDSGVQTRLLRFRPEKSAPGRATWQGDSVSEWQVGGRGASLLLQPARRVDGSRTLPGDPDRRGGSLRVVTTHMREGYLRKNGVPYSADTVLLEYWDVFVRENGDQWLMVTSEVTDPMYLREPRLVTYQFKKESTPEKWDPTPCSSRW